MKNTARRLHPAICNVGTTKLHVIIIKLGISAPGLIERYDAEIILHIKRDAIAIAFKHAPIAAHCVAIFISLFLPCPCCGSWAERRAGSRSMSLGHTAVWNEKRKPLIRVSWEAVRLPKSETQ